MDTTRLLAHDICAAHCMLSNSGLVFWRLEPASRVTRANTTDLMSSQLRPPLTLTNIRCHRRGSSQNMGSSQHISPIHARTLVQLRALHLLLRHPGTAHLLATCDRSRHRVVELQSSCSQKQICRAPPSASAACVQVDVPGLLAVHKHEILHPKSKQVQRNGTVAPDTSTLARSQGQQG